MYKVGSWHYSLRFFLFVSFFLNSRSTHDPIFRALLWSTYCCEVTKPSSSMLDCKLLVCQWQLESVSSSGTLDSIDIVGPTSSWFWLVREKEVTLMSAVMLNYIQNCSIFKLTIQNTVYFSVFSPKKATEDLYPLILCKKTFQFSIQFCL